MPAAEQKKNASPVTGNKKKKEKVKPVFKPYDRGRILCCGIWKRILKSMGTFAAFVFVSLIFGSAVGEGGLFLRLFINGGLLLALWYLLFNEGAGDGETDVALGETVPNGACALVSNGNYRPEIGEIGKKVAAVTLAELEKLGVENKGFLYRNSNDTRYPNGKIADYYGAVRYGILANIPSTLIEHGFLRNEGDFRAILSSEDKLRAVAKADAAGIVQYFGLEEKTADDFDDVPPLRLRDVPGHWAAENITTAMSKGWVAGYPDRTFRPNTTLTRADFVTLLSRMSGEDLSGYTGDPFPDVPESKYYAASVAWAVQAGIVAGFPDGNFRPTENVTREQMAHIMRLYLQHRGVDVSEIDQSVDARIADVDDIGSWALDDVRFCYAAGLLQGRGSTFVPRGTATRAEAATVLLRLYDFTAAADGAEPPEPAEPDAEPLTLTTPICTGPMPDEAAA